MPLRMTAPTPTMQDAKEHQPKEAADTVALLPEWAISRPGPKGMCWRRGKKKETETSGWGASAAPHAEPPALPSPSLVWLGLLGRLIRVEVQAVPDHGAPVVLEADPPLALRHEALGHHMAHDPAADPLARRIDGRVLEPSGPVAGPVVGRLRRQGV